MSAVNSRKQFLNASAAMGMAAFSGSALQAASAQKVVTPYPEMTAFPKKPVKSVIYLHMVGGPSHLDLFEHKPMLQEMHGKKMPSSFLEGRRFAFLRGHPTVMGSPFEFKKHGQSGLELCDLWKHLPEVADDITMVKSIHTDQFNHGPAQVLMQTGFGRFGRPCMGAWVNYGIGTDNPNLPGFVVLQRGGMPGAGSSLWSNGFLPGQYQGIKFLDSNSPVHFLSNPDGLHASTRADMVKAINHLNEKQYQKIKDPDIQTRMLQYDLANRMQSTMPDVAELNQEPKHIREMYGKGGLGEKCLLARRLVERGVRFVQIYQDGWDTHSSLEAGLKRQVPIVDRGVTALIKDLKQRGMLDETLVIFGGEFGRTPMMQGKNGEGKETKAGRDHHIDGFCKFMVGGPLKRGFTYGKTDEFGFNIVENPVHIHDFHATVLHMLGIDHQKLSYRFQGRDYRLTDIGGRIITDLYA